MAAKELVLNTLTALFVNFDPEAASQLLAEDYIQHNVGVPTGAAPVLGFLPVLKESGLKPTIHRVIAEDDLVVMHITYENAQLFGAPTQVAFDIFRVEDGKVAEHWDNLQPIEPPNPSGRTMTDGATDITDLEKTSENKALIEAFFADVLLAGSFDKVTDYISTETYIQHNPWFADGLDGVMAGFVGLAEAGTPIAYTQKHITVAEGNFVFTASEGTFGDEPTAFFDLFRIEDGKIVEHWDTVSAIPDEMAHDNGKF